MNVMHGQWHQPSNIATMSNIDTVNTILNKSFQILGISQRDVSLTAKRVEVDDSGHALMNAQCKYSHHFLYFFIVLLYFKIVEFSKQNEFRNVKHK